MCKIIIHAMATTNAGPTNSETRHPHTDQTKARVTLHVAVLACAKPQEHKRQNFNQYTFVNYSPAGRWPYLSWTRQSLLPIPAQARAPPTTWRLRLEQSTLHNSARDKHGKLHPRIYRKKPKESIPCMSSTPSLCLKPPDTS